LFTYVFVVGEPDIVKCRTAEVTLLFVRQTSFICEIYFIQSIILKHCARFLADYKCLYVICDAYACYADCVMFYLMNNWLCWIHLEKYFEY
jgi:hypothetical protein